MLFYFYYSFNSEFLILERINAAYFLYGILRIPTVWAFMSYLFLVTVWTDVDWLVFAL
jgi:hypothetical protein